MQFFPVEVVFALLCIDPTDALQSLFVMPIVFSAPAIDAQIQRVEILVILILQRKLLCR